MSKKNNQEVVVEETKVAAEETTAVVKAKEAGKGFAKKAIVFGKKALPVALAFGAGVGACIIAGAISKKSSSTDAEGSDATDDGSEWDDTLEELKSEE